MIAVSGFWAMEGFPRVSDYQYRAIKSWVPVFDRIYLFGKANDQVAFHNVEFIESVDYPFMSLLYLVASQSIGPATIINADIVTASHLRGVLFKAFDSGATAVTSQRYEFDPDVPHYNDAKVVDLGADFFCALPEIWFKAWKEVPPWLRLGNCLWDNWLIGFLSLTCRRGFVNITGARAIFHPRHTERKRIPMDETEHDKYLKSGFGFPRAMPA